MTECPSSSTSFQMDELPYIDTLFKEYLLFRGFTQTLRVFESERAGDRVAGFQVKRIVQLIFQVYIPQFDHEKLLALLDFLSQRVFARLGGTFQQSTQKLELSVIRYYVVFALKRGRPDKVKALFELAAEKLLHQSSDWNEWFALPYIRTPAKDQRFAVFFSAEWLDMLHVSVCNCLEEVFANVPLPAVLRFNEDRLHRKSTNDCVP